MLHKERKWLLQVKLKRQKRKEELLIKTKDNFKQKQNLTDEQVFELKKKL